MRTPILEDAALVPTNPYGESKLLVEQMLSSIHPCTACAMPACAISTSRGAVPGRGEAHGPEFHIIPLILDVALGRRQSIKVFSQDYPTPDGTCIRDYIRVQDLAEAHLLAFEGLDVRDRMIYNLGNGSLFGTRSGGVCSPGNRTSDSSG